MISGIEVLNTYTYTTGGVLEASILFILAFICIILGFVIIGSLIYFSGDFRFFILSLFPLIFSIFLTITGAACKEPITTTYYEVIIDDNVDFKDIYEKYEIIDVKGKIYTLKLEEVE